MFNKQKKLDGYTQAEIQGVVIKGLELAKRERNSIVCFEHLVTAIRFVQHSGSNEIKEMIDIAIKECNDLEFLPISYKEC